VQDVVVIYNNNFSPNFSNLIRKIGDRDIICLNLTDIKRDDSININDWSLSKTIKELLDINAHLYTFVSTSIYDFSCIERMLSIFNCMDVGCVSPVVSPSIFPFNYYKCRSYKVGVVHVPVIDRNFFITRRLVLQGALNVKLSSHFLNEGIDFVISHFSKGMGMYNLSSFNDFGMTVDILNVDYSDILNDMRKKALFQGIHEVVNMIDSFDRYIYDKSWRGKRGGCYLGVPIF